MLFKMFRAPLRWAGVVLMAAGGVAAWSQQEPVAASQAAAKPAAVSAEQALLNRYCITCHNERLHTANLLLDKADLSGIASNAEVWEKVVRKLRAGQMPPAQMPRPEKDVLEGFAAYLETELDRAAMAKLNPGRTGLHRLNRTEYKNAVRDILALEINVESLLPRDDSEYGFDNIAQTLSVSPLLMEGYMAAARKISRLAVGNPNIRPVTETHHVPKNLIQKDRRNEDLPFGSRGGTAFRHLFPLDGEYVIKVNLQRNNDGYIRGLREPHQLDVRLDDERIQLLAVGGERLGRSSAIFPRNNRDNRGDPKQVEYEYWADEALQVRFHTKAGTRLVQATFLNQSVLPEGKLMPELVYGDMGQYKGGDPAVDSVAITGPFGGKQPEETPSRQRIFQCHPTEQAEAAACARRILSGLARLAYRRPVTEEDLRPLLTLYDAGQREEVNFELGIEMALRRILAGPEFLFRSERDRTDVAPGTAYRVSDLELATRLSSFLWSSVPDEELLGIAERGELQKAGVLEQQVRRMLVDSKSRALVENFAGQWLYLRNIETFSPDTRIFPEFDDDLREALLTETQLFFESMLRENRGVMELLEADYTFLNERLARHYGIPDVYGSHFRRVSLAGRPERHGLLGQGSVLMVTSYGNRTSPVKRGQWVLKQLLGTPPPAPPPDVANTLEGVEKERKDGRLLTIREQMDLHRNNPRCSGCHSLMDPIGFALENFNAIGALRDRYDGGVPVDSAGVFYDGAPFQGPVDFRGVLLTKREAFIRNVVEKLMTYALGRQAEFYDAPAVRKIVRDTATDDYRWSSVILGIVNSVPFQMRRAPEL